MALRVVIPADLRDPIQNPFQLFPEELWGIIFKKVEVPQDLISVMNSTMEWYTMLEKTRKFLLFPKVLNVLQTQGYLDEENRDKAHHSSSLLRCRLVCQEWNQAVQNFCQLHPAHFRLDSWDSDKSNLTREAFYSERILNKFLRGCGVIATSDDNLFLSRRILICDKELGEIDAQEEGYLQRIRVFGLARLVDPEIETICLYWNSATCLLEKYGNDVYHLEISLEYHVTAALFYTLLERWLRLTPNLTTLRIQIRSGDVGRLSRKNLLRFQQQIQAFPLPTLEHLVLLKTDEVPSLICHQLLQRNCHIEKLQIKFNSDLKANYGSCFSQIRLNNLREWNIDLNSREDENLLQSVVSSIRLPTTNLYINSNFE